MIITSELLRQKYKEVSTYILYPIGTLDKRYVIPTVEQWELCHQHCDRYKRMVFSEEISDCDNFALQYYADFTWNWMNWTKGDTFAEDSHNIVRKFYYQAAIGIATGLMFRGHKGSHTVTCTYREDGFIIFDPLNKELYELDPKQDIIIKVEMP